MLQVNRWSPTRTDAKRAGSKIFESPTTKRMRPTYVGNETLAEKDALRKPVGQHVNLGSASASVEESAAARKGHGAALLSSQADANSAKSSDAVLLAASGLSETTNAHTRSNMGAPSASLEDSGKAQTKAHRRTSPRSGKVTKKKNRTKLGAESRRSKSEISDMTQEKLTHWNAAQHPGVNAYARSETTHTSTLMQSSQIAQSSTGTHARGLQSFADPGMHSFVEPTESSHRWLDVDTHSDDLRDFGNGDTLPKGSRVCACVRARAYVCSEKHRHCPQRTQRGTSCVHACL